MKNYEVESLAKSFALFFVLIASIYLLFMWQSYLTKKQQLDTRILQEMRIFTFDPVTQAFDVTFVPKDANRTLLTLHHAPKEVYGYFRIPTLDDELMKVSLSAPKYAARLKNIRLDVLRWTALFLLVIAGISLLLAYYALRPIRQALRLNKEFMKDILHDVNTPMASIVVNLKLLQKKFGTDSSIDRIGSNVETIGMLRENLHAYLGDQEEEESVFDLGLLLEERLTHFRTLYPQVTFTNQVEKVALKTRKRAMVRILDNLLGNAAKYNRKGGSVTTRMEGMDLIIEDTGRGIRDTAKVFRRHYKEGERGMGLGLHIVQNLCRKLGIAIAIESEVDVGTQVKLVLHKVIQK